MFLFQGIYEKALEELSANHRSAPSRLLPQEHVQKPTFEGAYSKLATAKRVQESVYGLFDYISGITKKDRGKKPWNEAACLKVLEDMGYEDPKQAFTSFQLSTFENYLNNGRVMIDDLKKIHDATQNAALKWDLEIAANAGASIFLAKNSKYILWAAHDWARDAARGGRMDTFYEFVDANTYLASTNLNNLYFSGDEINGRFEALAEPNTSLNKAYLSILPSSLKINFQAKDNVRLVEEYSNRLEDYQEAYQKCSSIALENFSRKMQIANASTWHEKAYHICGPYAEAAMPVVMALAMLEPAAAPLGYAYFANEAKNTFKEGEYLQGTLMSLTLAAPLFGFMRGFGGALGRAGAFGSMASHGAGTVFQLQIAASTIPLVIDGAKYGMSDAEIAQLGANAGFLAMPFTVRGLNRKVNEGLNKQDLVKKNRIKKNGDAGKNLKKTAATAGKKVKKTAETVWEKAKKAREGFSKEIGGSLAMSLVPVILRESAHARKESAHVQDPSSRIQLHTEPLEPIRHKRLSDWSGLMDVPEQYKSLAFQINEKVSATPGIKVIDLYRALKNDIYGGSLPIPLFNKAVGYLLGKTSANGDSPVKLMEFAPSNEPIGKGLKEKQDRVFREAGLDKALGLVEATPAQKEAQRKLAIIKQNRDSATQIKEMLDYAEVIARTGKNIDRIMTLFKKALEGTEKMTGEYKGENIVKIARKMSQMGFEGMARNTLNSIKEKGIEITDALKTDIEVEMAINQENVRVGQLLAKGIENPKFRAQAYAGLAAKAFLKNQMVFAKDFLQLAEESAKTVDFRFDRHKISNLKPASILCARYGWIEGGKILASRIIESALEMASQANKEKEIAKTESETAVLEKYYEDAIEMGWQNRMEALGELAVCAAKEALIKTAPVAVRNGRFRTATDFFNLAYKESQYTADPAFRDYMRMDLRENSQKYDIKIEYGKE